MFPDDMEPELVGSVLIQSLAALPEGLSDEQIYAAAQEKLKAGEEKEKKKNPGDSKQITRDYYDSLLLEMRLMGTRRPNTELQLFGQQFSSPIMTAALSHLGRFKPGVETMMDWYAQAAKLANVLHWVGMCDNDWFGQIMRAGAKTVRIVKPYADEDKIISQLKFAEECGAVAVGMDIDHTFTETGDIDVILGEKMAVKSLKDMETYRNATQLPFVVKGILSVSDALKCREIGADAIVVSHHGGRLAYAVPPVRVLPEIRKAVGEDLKIFVDCGVSSGMDAYKAMALGADAVSVGGHLIPALRGGGAAGAAARIAEMNAELRGAMAYTGIEDCNSFDPTVIHR